MTLTDGWPPFYYERKLGADINVGQLYVAFVATALVFAFVLVLPGFRGLEVGGIACERPHLIVHHLLLLLEDVFPRTLVVVTFGRNSHCR